MTEERNFGDPRAREELVQTHVDGLWRRFEAAGTQLSQAGQVYGSENPLLLAEALLRVRTRDAINTTFGLDRLEGLVGFTLSESGHQRLVLHRGLNPASRMFLYFHILGHIAKGHLGVGDELKIKYELRDRRKLPENVLAEEREADEWAVAATDKSTDNPLTASVRNVILEQAEELKRGGFYLTYYSDFLPGDLIDPEEDES